MYIIRNIAKQFHDLDFQVRKFIPAICIILTIIVCAPAKVSMYVIMMCMYAMYY